MSNDDGNIHRLKKAFIKINELQNQINSLSKTLDEPIAIIGMACRFADGINNIHDYWQALIDGRNTVTSIPIERWDKEAYYDSSKDTPGKINIKKIGWIKNIDQFDAEFFNITPREAVDMDPQHRLLLEVAWEALEHAGIQPDSLFESKTGVFTSILNHDYSDLILMQGQEQYANPYSALSYWGCIASGRISYFLGLRGPNMAIDTGCSASLMSLHEACYSLRRRECHLAIAGGCHLVLSPERVMNYCRVGVLSPSGACRTFSNDADGFAKGEGCGLVILKRLSDAIYDKDRIIAVVKGSAINDDGASAGLTVPSGPAQQAVITDALSNAHLTPNDIDYIEAHGTGTPLGDPIEFRALNTIFGNTKSNEHPLLVGSVKTNLGHLESAAGIASIIKVALALEHESIPEQIHFKELNEHIDLEPIPARIALEKTPWPKDKKPRNAGISSFSLSGANAHVILQEAPENDAEYIEFKPDAYLFVLSAKSKPALEQYINFYICFLEKNPQISLKDLCYTLQVGRTHFDYRIAIMASNLRKLIKKLSDAFDKILEVKSNNESIVFKHIDSHNFDIETATNKKIYKLGNNIVWKDLFESLYHEYMLGTNIKWQQLYSPYDVLKCEALSYPFQRQPYWSEKAKADTGNFVDTKDIDHKLVVSEKQFYDLVKNVEMIKQSLNLSSQATTFGAERINKFDFTRAIDKAMKNSQTWLTDFAKSHNYENYDTFKNSLDQLCCQYFIKFLSDLGIIIQNNQTISVSDLLERYEIKPMYERFLSRFLQHLVANGLLKHDQDAYQITSDISTVNIDPKILEDEYPQFKVELALTTRCGEQLKAILFDELDPIQLLFSKKNDIDAANYYHDAPAYQVLNDILGKVVETIFANIPENSKVHILEVGAGTGGTTSYVLPYLSDKNCQYTFTDISDVFLKNASKKFNQYNFIEYKQLNIENNPQEQGYIPETYDLIIASNVLHATSDITKTLNHVKSLLRAGGALLLLEATYGQAWLDLTFGLVSGWWAFTDQSVRQYPLMTPQQWETVCQQVGYGQINIISDASLHPDNQALEAIIIATVAADQGVVSDEGPVATDWSSLNQNELDGSIKSLILNIVTDLTTISDTDSIKNKSFFELGMDSLMATELRNRVIEQLGENMELPMTLMNDHPDLSQLADFLVSEVLKNDQVKLAQIEAAAKSDLDKDNLPLSCAQKRIWHEYVIHEGDTLANADLYLSINGEVDIEKFQAALNSVYETHDILGATFSAQNSDIRQHLAAVTSPDFKFIDLSEADADHQITQVQEYIENNRLSPFDLTNGPPSRFSLIKLSDKNYIFGLEFHHLVVDAPSIIMFFNSLCHIYFKQKHKTQKQPSSFSKFISHQETRKDHPVYQKDLTYWSEKLRASHGVIELPHKKDVTTTKYVEKLYNFELDNDLSKQLIDYAKSHNMTLFSFLAGLYQLMLMNLSGDDDINLATPYVNKPSNLGHVFGYFVNVLILRPGISTQTNFFNYLTEYNHTLNDAINHQHIPYEDIHQHLLDNKLIGSPSLFNMSFSLLSAVKANQQFGDWTINVFETDSAYPELGVYDETTAIKTDMYLLGETLSGKVKYGSNYYSTQHIENLINTFTFICQACIKDNKIP